MAIGDPQARQTDAPTQEPDDRRPPPATADGASPTETADGASPPAAEPAAAAVPQLYKPGNRQARRDISLTAGTFLWGIVAVLAVVFFLAAVQQLVSIILLVFLAITIALGLMPLVNRLERWRLPRVLAGLLVYLAVFGGLVVLIVYTISPVTRQASELVRNAPSLLNDFYHQLPPPVQEPLNPLFSTTAALTGGQAPTATATLSATGAVTETTTVSTTAAITRTTTVTNPAGTAPASGASNGLGSALAGVDLGAIFSLVVGLVGGIGTFAVGLTSVLVIAFYWMMLGDEPQRIFLTVIPPGRRAYVSGILTELAVKIGGYIRGDLILGLIIGAASYAGLLFIQIPYALVLAVFAGLMELIPTIGPVVGAIPALAVGFATGGLAGGLKVLVLYTILQQLESNIAVPRVMGATVDLPPLLVLVSVLMWGVLFGLLGAILAVPITSLIIVVVNRLVLPYLQQRAAASG